MKKLVLIIVGIFFLSNCAEKITLGEFLNSPEKISRERVFLGNAVNKKMLTFCKENSHPACVRKSRLKNGGYIISQKELIRVVKKAYRLFTPEKEPEGLDLWVNLPEAVEVKGDCEDFALLFYKMSSRYGLENVHIVYGLAGDERSGIEGEGGHVWIEVTDLLFFNTILIDQHMVSIRDNNTGEITPSIKNDEKEKIRYKKFGVIRWWLPKNIRKKSKGFDLVFFSF